MGRPYFCVYLLCVVLNHYAGRWIHVSPPARARAILAACLTLDLAVLVYYKYFNFLSDQVSSGLGLFDLHWQPGLRVALSIGVSFFVFKAMSYPIEIYRGLEAPPRRLTDFGAWLSLSPDLIAGPIVRFSDVSREMFKRTVTVELLFSGLTRFGFGLGKVEVILNALQVPNTWPEELQAN